MFCIMFMCTHILKDIQTLFALFSLCICTVFSLTVTIFGSRNGPEPEQNDETPQGQYGFSFLYSAV